MLCDMSGAHCSGKIFNNQLNVLFRRDTGQAGVQVLPLMDQCRDFREGGIPRGCGRKGRAILVSVVRGDIHPAHEGRAGDPSAVEEMDELVPRRRNYDHSRSGGPHQNQGGARQILQGGVPQRALRAAQRRAGARRVHRHAQQPG
eukprot:1177910-Prorocentrum_minimum.AAC.1